MLKVHMLENISNGDNSMKRDSTHSETSPNRLSCSNDDDDCQTPTSSPSHHSPAVPTQSQMTTGNTKSASQGSSPAGYV